MAATPPNSREVSDWLVQLRHQLLPLARRRVGADEAEDIVQTSMAIIAERGLSPDDDSVEGLPPVAWCLQVLRNVIGNHYRRQSTRSRYVDEAAELDRVPAPLEGQDDPLVVRTIDEAFDALEKQDDACARYLRRLADGMPVARLAEELALEANALYQRLYRCRRKFRIILREKGVLP